MRWHSSVFDISVPNNNGKNAVTVPESGFYGFFLGCSSRCRRNEKKKEQQSLFLHIRVQDDDVVVADEDDVGNDETRKTPSNIGTTISTVKHGLPFRVEGGKELVDLDVGYLIYLPRNCLVHVEIQQQQQEEEEGKRSNGSSSPTTARESASNTSNAIDLISGETSNHIDDVNNHNNDDDNQKVLYHWRLICHRMTGQSERNAAAAAANDNSNTNNNNHNNNDGGRRSKPHPQPRPKKSLVCAMCSRSFATIRAVTSHIQSSHRDRQTTATTTTNNNKNVSSSSTATNKIASNCSCRNSLLYNSEMWKTPLEVMYQDPFVAVVIKPQGMPVQGAKESLHRSDLLLPLANYASWSETKKHQHQQKKKKKIVKKRALEQQSDTDDATMMEEGKDKSNYQQQKEEEIDTSFTKPRPIHRLDAGTGGLLVLAKTRFAERQLKNVLATRQCQKTYHALVIGAFSNEGGDDANGNSTATTGSSSSPALISGECDKPLWGKPALTKYKVLRCVPSKQWGYLSLVELQLMTGRKHQLRRHMSLLGHPILGDRRYGGGGCYSRTDTTGSTTSKRGCGGGGDEVEGEGEEEEDDRVFDEEDVDPYSRLCLWAVQIIFPHPSTPDQIISCKMDEPEWLKYVLRYEECKEEQQLTAAEASRGRLLCSAEGEQQKIA